MEAISLTDAINIVPIFTRRELLKLVRWGVIDSVEYGDRTLITVESIRAALARMEKAYPEFSLEELRSY